MRLPAPRNLNGEARQVTAEIIDLASERAKRARPTSRG
jgi:hypothetical protein